MINSNNNKLHFVQHGIWVELRTGNGPQLSGLFFDMSIQAHYINPFQSIDKPVKEKKIQYKQQRT